MDKPISVGDLVVVVKPPLCPMPSHDYLGLHFIVRSLFASAACMVCGEKHAPPGSISAEADGLPIAFPLYRLKRIPPLDDLRGKKDVADKPITLDGQIERLRKLVGA